MSIIKGSLSYSAFLVSFEASLTPETIMEKLRLFKFRALHPLGEDQETLGWCSFLSEYDAEKSIEIRDFLYDDKIILSMRVDVISLPKALLKANVRKSINNYYHDHKKWPDKVIKKEIELAEAKALRARVLPKTKIVEAMWDQKKNMIRVFCRAKKQLDQFGDLFAQTFLVRPALCDFSYRALPLKDSVENITHQPIFMPRRIISVQ